MRRRACLWILLCLPCAAQPWTAGDLWEYRLPEDPQIAPDASRVAFAVRWQDRDADTERSGIWLISKDGGSPSQLTGGSGRDRSPRWSPDGGRLAWISERDGRSQIRVRSGTGESPIETGGLRPLELAWAPEGTRLAFTAITGPGPREYSRLFVVEAKGGPTRAISPEGLDCRGEPAWMPDGSAILTATAGGSIERIGVPDGAVTPLATDGRNQDPRPSPDGAKIAWLCTEDRAPRYAVRKVWVMDADGSRARALSGSLDRDAASPRWSSDSRTVYFLADDGGATHVYAARNDGTVRQASRGDDRMRGLSLADNGRAATVRWTSAEGGAVATLDVYGLTDPAIVARPNRDLAAARQYGTVEKLAYPSAGHTIEAWLTRPPGFDAGKKYPLLLEIRDAPGRACGPWFSLRSQVFAARGWVVLCANPRGTPGYGEAFGSRLPIGWQEDVFDDLMRGVDAALALGYIDPRRLTVMGGSEARWTLAHTERFAAAVIRGERPAAEKGQPPGRTPILALKSRDDTDPGPGRRIAEWEAILAWLGK